MSAARANGASGAGSASGSPRVQLARGERPRQRARTQAVGICAVCLVASAAGAVGGTHASGRARASAEAPNVVLVVVDDQADNSFKAGFQPQTFRWLVDGGTR